jgi:hypothetical protein
LFHAARPFLLLFRAIVAYNSPKNNTEAQRLDIQDTHQLKFTSDIFGLPHDFNSSNLLTEAVVNAVYQAEVSLIISKSITMLTLRFSGGDLRCLSDTGVG